MESLRHPSIPFTPFTPKTPFESFLDSNADPKHRSPHHRNRNGIHAWKVQLVDEEISGNGLEGSTTESQRTKRMPFLSDLADSEETRSDSDANLKINGSNNMELAHDDDAGDSNPSQPQTTQKDTKENAQKSNISASSITSTPSPPATMTPAATETRDPSIQAARNDDLMKPILGKRKRDRQPEERNNEGGEEKERQDKRQKMEIPSNGNDLRPSDPNLIPTPPACLPPSAPSNSPNPILSQLGLHSNQESNQQQQQCRVPAAPNYFLPPQSKFPPIQSSSRSKSMLMSESSHPSPSKATALINPSRRVEPGYSSKYRLVMPKPNSPSTPLPGQKSPVKLPYLVPLTSEEYFIAELKKNPYLLYPKWCGVSPAPSRQGPSSRPERFKTSAPQSQAQSSTTPVASRSKEVPVSLPPESSSVSPPKKHPNGSLPGSGFNSFSAPVFRSEAGVGKQLEEGAGNRETVNRGNGMKDGNVYKDLGGSRADIPVSLGKPQAPTQLGDQSLLNTQWAQAQSSKNESSSLDLVTKESTIRHDEEVNNMKEQCRRLKERLQMLISERERKVMDSEQKKNGRATSTDDTTNTISRASSPTTIILEDTIKLTERELERVEGLRRSREELEHFHHQKRYQQGQNQGGNETEKTKRDGDEQKNKGCEDSNSNNSWNPQKRAPALFQQQQHREQFLQPQERTSNSTSSHPPIPLHSGYISPPIPDQSKSVPSLPAQPMKHKTQVAPRLPTSSSPTKFSSPSKLQRGQLNETNINPQPHYPLQAQPFLYPIAFGTRFPGHHPYSSPYPNPYGYPNPQHRPLSTNGSGVPSSHDHQRWNHCQCRECESYLQSRCQPQPQPRPGSLPGVGSFPQSKTAPPSAPAFISTIGNAEASQSQPPLLSLTLPHSSSLLNLGNGQTQSTHKNISGYFKLYQDQLVVVNGFSDGRNGAKVMNVVEGRAFEELVRACKGLEEKREDSGVRDSSASGEEKKDRNNQGDKIDPNAIERRDNQGQEPAGSASTSTLKSQEVYNTPNQVEKVGAQERKGAVIDPALC